MKPLMVYGSLEIFQLNELIARSMIRLTKWLFPTNEELMFCANEHKRISSDPSRQCVVVYHEGKVAVYVDDLTGGAFDQMEEDENGN